MIEVQAEELTELVNKIDTFNLLDPKIGHAMGNYLVKSASKRIRETKVSPAGDNWKDSKRSLVLGREALLKDTGNLLRGTGYRLEQWRKGILILDNKASVETKKGDDFNYAQALQEGTKKMSARPFLGMSDDDSKVLSAQIEKYVVTFLN